MTSNEPLTQDSSALERLDRVGWLHFYQMGRLQRPSHAPKIVVRADGIHLWDEKGRRYIDGLSGSYCMNLGYGRTSILERAHAAAMALPYASPFVCAHPWGVDLAYALSELARPVVGPDARVFFVNSGSEAVDTALKLARAYQRRSGSPRWRFVSREWSYHGTTWGAVSASGYGPMREDFLPLLQGVSHAPHTLCARCALGLEPATCSLACAQALEGQVNTPGPAAAAVLIEPFQNCGGNIPPPSGYLQAVADACRRAGTLLILDEVLCGFGRLGAWFGSALYGARADMLVCGKGLTGGYEALGAVIVSRNVADAFVGDGDALAFEHGATFGGRPAATAAALETLRILRDEDVVATAARRGARLLARLEQELGSLPIVGQVRGAGMLFGIDLVDPETRSLVEDGEFLERISEALFAAGLICRFYCMRQDAVIELAPPLVTSDSQCDEIAGILARVLRAAGVPRPRGARA